MAKKIRVAVLGVGRLGYYHAKNLKERVKGAELAAIVDPDETRAQRVAEEFGVGKWTKHASEIFADPDIDAVLIVTPTSTHETMIKHAAQNGKHIFVEKPLTSTVEEAEEAIRVINENDVICQVGFMRRYDPAYYEAKKKIEAGDIGQPIYFKGITRDSGSPPEEFIKNSGGIFLDCSIHDYDIARYLMNAEITSISAHGRILRNPFMEKYQDVDQAISYLEFDSGAAGDVEGSRNSPYGHDIRTEIIGTEGSLFIGTLRNQNVTILNAKGSNYEVIPDFQTRFADAYRMELESFIQCIVNKEAPRITSLDSKINMEVALAATSSFINEGKKVFIQRNFENVY